MTLTFRSFVLILAFAVGNSGYALAASMVEFTELSSTPVSIGVRALTILLCILSISLSPPVKHIALSRWIVFSISIFWLLYLFRMFNDTVYFGDTLLNDPSSYWIWAIGGSIIPLFCFANSAYSIAIANKFFHWCVGLTLLAAAFALPNLSTNVSAAYETYNSGRAGLAALNPISLGHLGAQLLILCLWGIFMNRHRESTIFRVILLGGSLLGFYVALVANSRGPLVALVTTIFFGIFSSNLRRKYWLAAISLVGIATFASTAALVDSVAGTNVYDRIVGQSQIDDVNTQSRFDLYNSALGQFGKSPLIGYGLEDPTFGGYPHNLAIESFMSTGLLGGLAFVSVLVLSLAAAIRVMRHVEPYGWLALLTVEQAVGGQFSGSLAQSTVFWGLVGALTSVASLPVAVQRKSTNSMLTRYASP